jgi:hypothetical protein
VKLLTLLCFKTHLTGLDFYQEPACNECFKIYFLETGLFFRILNVGNITGATTTHTVLSVFRNTPENIIDEILLSFPHSKY